MLDLKGQVCCKMIKHFTKTIVGVTLGGAAMRQVGTHMTGNVAGIGRATQIGIAAGILGHSIPKKTKKLLK